MLVRRDKSAGQFLALGAVSMSAKRSNSTGAKSSASASNSDGAAHTEVILFTDGACSGNPGPGGWAFILRHPASGKEIVQSGGEQTSTNNRMELTAVVRGLEALTRPAAVELVTDSSYVGKGLTEWMAKWKANGWRRREGQRWAPVKNEDLWRELDRLVAQHRLKYTAILGHSGHPENERCDELAVAAYQQYL